jgi:hypothetical protein
MQPWKNCCAQVKRCPLVSIQLTAWLRRMGEFFAIIVLTARNEDERKTLKAVRASGCKRQLARLATDGRSPN